jgi:hypothetical protein
MTTLVENLTAAGPRLTARVLGEMYEDPFWQERFGARGRSHANADGDFHVRYLVAALEGRDPGVFTAYARWLRDLLVARGMCSLHLRDNFVRLARAIADEGWPDAHEAIAVLDAGADAIVHRDGDAAAVERLQAELPAAAARLPGAADATARAALAWELRCLASFLADSLVGNHDRFGPHVEFLRRLHAARGVPGARVDAELTLLAANELPQRARQLLAKASEASRGVGA